MEFSQPQCIKRNLFIYVYCMNFSNDFSKMRGVESFRNKFSLTYIKYFQYISVWKNYKMYISKYVFTWVESLLKPQRFPEDCRTRSIKFRRIANYIKTHSYIIFWQLQPICAIYLVKFKFKFVTTCNSNYSSSGEYKVTLIHLWVGIVYSARNCASDH